MNRVLACIVEVAEAHGHAALCMVPRGAHNGRCVRHLTPAHFKTGIKLSHSIAPHSPCSKFGISEVHAAHLFDRACTQITKHCCCRFSINREISPRDSYRNVSAASGGQAGAVGGVRIHIGVLGEVGERGGFPRDARGLCRLARHRLDQVHVMAGLQLLRGGLSAGDGPAAVCTRMRPARQCLEGCIFAHSLAMTCPSA